MKEDIKELLCRHIYMHTKHRTLPPPPPPSLQFLPFSFALLFFVFFYPKNVTLSPCVHNRYFLAGCVYVCLMMVELLLWFCNLVFICVLLLLEFFWLQDGRGEVFYFDSPKLLSSSSFSGKYFKKGEEMLPVCLLLWFARFFLAGLLIRSCSSSLLCSLLYEMRMKFLFALVLSVSKVK